MAGETTDVLFSGTLATPRRTVMGIFGALERSEIPLEAAAGFLVDCGLPPIALTEPDIPITRAQQLRCLGRLLDHMDRARSIPLHATESGLGIHVTVLGILGLTLMYADSLRECLRVITSYAEMSWGHCRIAVRREGDAIVESFVMDERGAPPDPRLRAYCVTLDLTATMKMTRDLFGPTWRPTRVGLPYPAPPDHRELGRQLGCPVEFDAPEAWLEVDAALWRATPLLANPFVFRAFERQTAELARRLRTDVPLAEQVRRLLFATATPADRDDVAAMLAMSPRTLARKLAQEGTGFSELTREVRLARAEEYLRNRTLRLSEIADRLGFSDPAAFSRAFRQWTGETPSAWREHALG